MVKSIPNKINRMDNEYIVDKAKCWDQWEGEEMVQRGGNQMSLPI